MSRLHGRPGWLLFAGPPEIGVVHGDVLTWELSVENSAWARGRLRVTCELYPDSLRRVTVNGKPGEAAHGELMWQALQAWPDEKAGRRWPPEMTALLELARAHPEEYERLCEGEAVLRALGGLAWDPCNSSSRKSAPAGGGAPAAAGSASGSPFTAGTSA